LGAARDHLNANGHLATADLSAPFSTSSATAPSTSWIFKRSVLRPVRNRGGKLNRPAAMKSMVLPGSILSRPPRTSLYFGPISLYAFVIFSTSDFESGVAAATSSSGVSMLMLTELTTNGIEAQFVMRT